MKLGFLTLLLLLLWPGSAWAWGPSAHLHFGLQILDNLALLPAHCQELLALFRHQYLYGCISADIIVGKRFIEYRYHCHNWAIGLQLLRKAEKDSLRAFVLGYMSHLAADTIAHNLFVPLKMIDSHATPAKGHLYWESVFDSRVATQKTVDMIYSLSGDPYEEEDQFLRNSLKPTLFSFGTNKKLFNGFLLLQRFRQWQKLIDSSLRRGKVPLDRDEVTYYNELCLNVILGVLIDGSESRYLRLDPTGSQALDKTQLLARRLRGEPVQGEPLSVEGCRKAIHDDFRLLLGMDIEGAIVGLHKSMQER